MTSHALPSLHLTLASLTERMLGIRGEYPNLIRSIQSMIKSRDGLQDHLDWDIARDHEFQLIAQIVYLISEKVDSRDPSPTRIETWLTEMVDQVPSHDVVQSVTSAVGTLLQLARHPKLSRPLKIKKLAPFDLVMVVYLIYYRIQREYSSDLEQLSEAIQGLRTYVRTTHTEVLFNAKLYKRMKKSLKSMPRAQSKGQGPSGDMLAEDDRHSPDLIHEDYFACTSSSGSSDESDDDYLPSDADQVTPCTSKLGWKRTITAPASPFTTSSIPDTKHQSSGAASHSRPLLAPRIHGYETVLARRPPSLSLDKRGSRKPLMMDVDDSNTEEHNSSVANTGAAPQAQYHSPSLLVMSRTSSVIRESLFLPDESDNGESFLACAGDHPSDMGTKSFNTPPATITNAERHPRLQSSPLLKTSRKESVTKEPLFLPHSSQSDEDELVGASSSDYTSEKYNLSYPSNTETKDFHIPQIGEFEMEFTAQTTYASSPLSSTPHGLRLALEADASGSGEMGKMNGERHYVDSMKDMDEFLKWTARPGLGRPLAPNDCVAPCREYIPSGESTARGHNADMGSDRGHWSIGVDGFFVYVMHK